MLIKLILSCIGGICALQPQRKKDEAAVISGQYLPAVRDAISHGNLEALSVVGKDHPLLKGVDEPRFWSKINDSMKKVDNISMFELAAQHGQSSVLEFFIDNQRYMDISPSALFSARKTAQDHGHYQTVQCIEARMIALGISNFSYLSSEDDYHIIASVLVDILHGTNVSARWFFVLCDIALQGQQVAQPEDKFGGVCKRLSALLLFIRRQVSVALPGRVPLETENRARPRIRSNLISCSSHDAATYLDGIFQPSDWLVGNLLQHIKTPHIELSLDEDQSTAWSTLVGLRDQDYDQFNLTDLASVDTAINTKVRFLMDRAWLFVQIIAVFASCEKHGITEIFSRLQHLTNHRVLMLLQIFLSIKFCHDSRLPTLWFQMLGDCKTFLDRPFVSYVVVLHFLREFFGRHLPWTKTLFAQLRDFDNLYYVKFFLQETNFSDDQYDVSYFRENSHVFRQLLGDCERAVADTTHANLDMSLSAEIESRCDRVVGEFEPLDGDAKVEDVLHRLQKRILNTSISSYSDPPETVEALQTSITNGWIRVHPVVTFDHLPGRLFWKTLKRHWIVNDVLNLHFREFDEKDFIFTIVLFLFILTWCVLRFYIEVQRIENADHVLYTRVDNREGPITAIQGGVEVDVQPISSVEGGWLVDAEGKHLAVRAETMIKFKRFLYEKWATKSGKYADILEFLRVDPTGTNWMQIQSLFQEMMQESVAEQPKAIVIPDGRKMYADDLMMEVIACAVSPRSETSVHRPASWPNVSWEEQEQLFRHRNSKLRFNGCWEIVQKAGLLICTVEQLEELIHRHSNQTDRLTEDQFSNLINDLNPELKLHEIGRLFDYFDRSRSGAITRDQIIEGLQTPIAAGQMHRTIRDGVREEVEFLRQIFDEYAADDGGLINRDQFQEILSQLDMSIDAEDLQKLLMLSTDLILNGPDISFVHLCTALLPFIHQHVTSMNLEYRSGDGDYHAHTYELTRVLNLVYFIKTSDVEGTRAILERHPKLVNEFIHENMTPLMLTVYACASTDMFKLLLELGADVTVKNPNGKAWTDFAKGKDKTYFKKRCGFKYGGQGFDFLPDSYCFDSFVDMSERGCELLFRDRNFDMVIRDQEVEKAVSKYCENHVGLQSYHAMHRQFRFGQLWEAMHCSADTSTTIPDVKEIVNAFVKEGLGCDFNALLARFDSEANDTIGIVDDHFARLFADIEPNPVPPAFPNVHMLVYACASGNLGLIMACKSEYMHQRVYQGRSPLMLYLHYYTVDIIFQKKYVPLVKDAVVSGVVGRPREQSEDLDTFLTVAEGEVESLHQIELDFQATRFEEIIGLKPKIQELRGLTLRTFWSKVSQHFEKKEKITILELAERHGHTSVLQFFKDGERQFTPTPKHVHQRHYHQTVINYFYENFGSSMFLVQDPSGQWLLDYFPLIDENWMMELNRVLRKELLAVRIDHRKWGSDGMYLRGYNFHAAIRECKDSSTLCSLERFFEFNPTSFYEHFGPPKGLQEGFPKLSLLELARQFGAPPHVMSFLEQRREAEPRFPDVAAAKIQAAVKGRVARTHSKALADVRIKESSFFQTHFKCIYKHRVSAIICAIAFLIQYFVWIG